MGDLSGTDSEPIAFTGSAPPGGPGRAAGRASDSAPRPDSEQPFIKPFQDSPSRVVSDSAARSAVPSRVRSLPRAEWSRVTHVAPGGYHRVIAARLSAAAGPAHT
eukprot:545192-Hanusia_phi.AAC.1